MLYAVDIDGTIDAFPAAFLGMMQALKACGHAVHVVSGVDAPVVTQQDMDAKAAYLVSLGCGEAYTRLVLVPDPHAENKASYLREAGADMLWDNSKANAQAAIDICPVLVPWQSREKE